MKLDELAIVKAIKDGLVDNVIQALDACSTDGVGCKQCPYYADGENASCLNQLLKDSSDLLTLVRYMPIEKGATK